MINFIYKTTNLINKKIYVGVHSCKKLDDCYLGSGKILKKAIAKYGKENFKREILYICETMQEAYEIEEILVCKDFINRTDVYNCKVGGKGGFIEDCHSGKYVKNTVPVIDQNGIVSRISIDEYKTGKYVSINKNTVCVFDKLDNIKKKIDIGEFNNNLERYEATTTGQVTVRNINGKIFNVSKEDVRYKNGEFISIHKDTLLVKDNKNNKFRVNINDDRYISGELIPHNKGTVTVKDKDGKIFNVSVDDDRYISGELKMVLYGITVVDEFGNKKFVDPKDPKFLDGTYKSITTGTVAVKDKFGNSFRVSTSDNRLKTGELVSCNLGKKDFYHPVLNIGRRFYEHEIEKAISDGWIKGRKPK